MESDRSDLARAAGEASAADDDPDLEASAAAGKGNKNRAFPQVFIFVSEGPLATGTETTSAWTGQKKAKIESAPTSGENSSGKIVEGQEQEREEIEGFYFDDDKLAEEVDCYLERLKDSPFAYYEEDDESFDFFDEEQLKALNQRLALCRIRAHEEKYQDMNDETLSAVYLPKDVEANDYYLHYELSLEWYFDPVYCQYAHFQDYQRLVLRKNGDYKDWEYYRRTCSTLEGDQEYVHFWESLLSNTQLIEWYTTRRSHELKIVRLLYYHTLKIAVAHPNIYKALIISGFIEFRRSLEIDFIWSRPYVDFVFRMWKLIPEKPSFKDALSHFYNDDKYSFIFANNDKFEPNVRPLEEEYKPFLDSIGEKTDEDAKLLIRHFVIDGMKPKTYYDYAKKKLGIAKKIGLIASAEAPRDKEVHGHTVKQGIGSKEG